MTPSLERLSELVRHAEAKTRAKKLSAEASQAAEALRETEARAQAATQRLREEKPARMRSIEQADADEIQLKELVKKLAQFKASLEPGADAEALIDGARAEIDRSRRESRAALDAVSREADEARKALRGAMDHYQQVRRELDRLQPQLSNSFSADDRLLWDAEVHFPGGQVQALAREVEAGAPFYGVLSRGEQYAQLKVWIGRFRQFQDAEKDEAGEEAATVAQRVFHQLKTLSRQYEPGYIEAFRLDFQTDWAAYVAEAQAQLTQATEAVRAQRDREQQQSEQAARDLERRRRTARPASPRSIRSAPSWPTTASPTRASTSSSTASRRPSAASAPPTRTSSSWSSPTASTSPAATDSAPSGATSTGSARPTPTRSRPPTTPGSSSCATSPGASAPS
jgi:hypothetical protein